MSGLQPAGDCAAKPALATQPKTISVNGVVISRAAIAQETQNHPATKPLDAMQAAARALVVRELLLQEARRLGLIPAPIADDAGRRETDDEALIRQAIEQEVVVPVADRDACQRYYVANRARFRTPDLYEVRHILLAAAPNENSGRAQASARAEALLEELARNPAAFAALAETASACPSGKTGGSLGQIGPGQTVPEFEAALSGLPVGAIAPTPVETRYGLHIVAVDRRIDGRDLPFDMVAATIAEFLTDRVQRTATRQYLSILAGRADIRGISLDATLQPLVQ
ncbi:peptidylprolyl isomerase [Elstera cyanobacteriorum]|uniref:Parvulin-like PPIase n=1 Tax=Elstera cyanobacteriorum TaxID=2022747 RepID=A0A255XS61_9PROT|nr:peptidylprolyl isomerase [Elstera cyanobacteriorum]OYQ19265.1 hypothetical protein CHR90_07425 [Elstera cyanobacteriorum]GFZ90183.1 peptidylprolyl isomerase [Elstera cyanobacteriorum]